MGEAHRSRTGAASGNGAQPTTNTLRLAAQALEAQKYVRAHLQNPPLGEILEALWTIAEAQAPPERADGGDPAELRYPFAPIRTGLELLKPSPITRW